jgi:hypothetical protein
VPEECWDHARTAKKLGKDYERHAALELVEAVLTPDPSGSASPNELDARASTHYDTKTLWRARWRSTRCASYIPALIAKSILARSSICVVSPARLGVRTRNRASPEYERAELTTAPTPGKEK